MTPLVRSGLCQLRRRPHVRAVVVAIAAATGRKQRAALACPCCSQLLAEHKPEEDVNLTASVFLNDPMSFFDKRCQDCHTKSRGQWDIDLRDIHKEGRAEQAATGCSQEEDL